MIRLTIFFGVLTRMLLRLDDVTIDPAAYLHTLAVSISLPGDWELEGRSDLIRCGVLLRSHTSYREDIWLPFDERDDFQGTILLRQPAQRDNEVTSWVYVVNTWYQSREVVPWHITLTAHPAVWSFSFGLAGSLQGVRVILPDYIPLARPQLESVGTG
jgi:hypothetical protein